jgi:toxin ParE1/3/4
MRIVWRRRAQDDLRAARRYIERDDPRAARRLVLRVLNAVDRLAAHPNRGRAGRVPGTRELIVTGTPYIVPYRVSGQEIQVLRVYHGARRWPSRL